MPIIQPISEHRIEVEGLPASAVIQALTVGNVYLLSRSTISKNYSCYIKILSIEPLTAPGESSPYDLNITGPAVYVENNNIELLTGEIGTRTISKLLSNNTHMRSDNWLIYTSDTSEYNDMVDFVINMVRRPPHDYSVFANAVNDAYPNRRKHLLQNYSVTQDELFYAVIESGTSNSSAKTLVVGDSTGILATKTQTVSGWGAYMDTMGWAIDGYFGFVGRTTDSSGRNNYLSIFHYENGEITAIQTGTSIDVGNWIRGDLSVFKFGGKIYIQGNSNRSKETLWYYNLTDRALTRKENTSHRVGGCAIGAAPNGEYVYLIASVNLPNTSPHYDLHVAQANNPTAAAPNPLPADSMSNNLPDLMNKVYRRMPSYLQPDRFYVMDSADWYLITMNEEYTSISSTLQWTLPSGANLLTLIIDNGLWYVDSSHNIVALS